MNLEGVNSFYYLFVEGEPVGFSKGAHSLSRFEVTDFIHGDTFEVTVVVLKWSDGTYLEDQDCYRYNGIYRDVYLTARPQSFIEDIEIHTRLENDYTDGVVEVTAKANGTVEDALMRLIAPDGTVLQACSAKAENGTLRAAFRVEKAAELLRSTRLRTGEIGAECGFADGSYFIKTFRELKHCTPKEYRQRFEAQ